MVSSRPSPSQSQALLAVLPLLVVLPPSSAAGEGKGRPSQPTGLAARYPGDRGIERDPRVLFAEGFEDGSVRDLERRWQSVSNKDGKVLAFADDAPPGSGGRRCLQLTATPGENTGGHLYKRLEKGVDRLHARFYVKFAEDAGYIHHFVTVGGYRPPTDWPQGGAGERPRGDDRVTVGVEPFGMRGRVPPPGAWNLYTYWHGMKPSAGGRYWGNGIAPEEPLVVPRGRWQCVEVMVRLNSSPDKADGEVTLWLDGKRALHVGPGTRRGPWTGLGFRVPEQGGEPFEGFRWRTSPDLRLNFFWLLHYVTDLAARQNRVDQPRRGNRVWFDDIVLATEYIGPLR